MAEQTLDVRGGGFLEELERLEGLEELDSLERLEGLEELDSLERLEELERLEVLEKLEAQQRAMAKHGRKRNNIARCTRAYTRTTGVLCFLLSQVSHKHYNPLCNNHLNRFQKQHSTLSHFHAATPPPKIPKTPSSKQLFVLQSKTTRHFPQNDTLFSAKRHVVLSKTTRCFP